MTQSYEPIIGLEVHAQLATRTKMFCGCSTAFGAAPNSSVCPVCLGLPGALPVPNRMAIELSVRAGLALGCSVRKTSRFARKSYFYPDLSKGYQISQFDLPLNEHGVLNYELDGVLKQASITRAHVEEDAAKNLHGIGAGTNTLVDFNRAGTPLLEIVGGPDLRNAAEAEAYLQALRELLMFAGVNDGNLEEGSFRCDANVSIRPVGQVKFGTRCELKNINSFKFVRKAIDYEIARQEAVLASGGKVAQETRTWSEPQQKTILMRTKEEAHDYRYFADPDLPPLEVDDAWTERVRAAMPELPREKRARWQGELGMTAYDAGVLTAHPAVARYVENTVAIVSEVAQRAGGKLALERGATGKRVANFVMSELLGSIATDGLEAQFPIDEVMLAELLALVDDGTINGKIAKDVLSEMCASGKRARVIVDLKGLAQITDEGAIEKTIREVVEKSPKELERYRGGKVTMLGFFVGQVMKATRGTANPAVVNEILKRVLDGG